MESKEKLLEVKNLSVDFRMDRKTVLHAVRNVSFTLEKGETLGLVGESGCGKSVSCMSILQLNPPQRTLYPTGEILFDGKDLLKMNQKQLRPIRGNEIAMVFQEPMTAMNPLFQVGRLRSEHRGGAPRQNSQPGAHFEQLSLRALRRHAPARDDCHGDDRPAQAAHL